MPRVQMREAKENNGACPLSSVSEGRFAAMRWLIEFVGVALDRDGNVCRPHRRPPDVAITHLLGGKEFDLVSDEAKFLSKVWKACSQAGGHPLRARSIRLSIRRRSTKLRG